MSVTRISIEEAARLIEHEGYRYVDVRTEAEYAGGHPKSAVNVPFLFAGAQLNPEFLEVMEKHFAKDAKLIVGCQSGGRSLRASEALLAAGYNGLLEMRAGFGGVRNAFGQVKEVGWAAAGMPVEAQTDGGTWAELKAKAER
jgi:rhodanese-related sulfurtransferase